MPMLRGVVPSRLHRLRRLSFTFSKSQACDVYSYIVKRTQIYVDEAQDESLASRAAATGVTKSTLIREAIDAYLKGRPDERMGLDRFRAAVRSAAGSADYLPDGKTYVEVLRAVDVRRQDEIEHRRRK